MADKDEDDDGIPVDYDPFPEDKTDEAMRSLMESLNSHINLTAKIQMEMSASINKLAGALESLSASQRGLARSLLGPRIIKRNENGKIVSIKVAKL